MLGIVKMNIATFTFPKSCKLNLLCSEISDALSPLLSPGPVVPDTYELNPVQLLHLCIVALLRTVLALGLTPGTTRVAQVRTTVDTAAFTSAATFTTTAATTTVSD